MTKKSTSHKASVSKGTGKRPPQSAPSPLLTWLMLGAVAVLFLYTVYRQIVFANRQGVSIPEISVEQAYAKYQQGAFVLDVRQPEEWEQGHIPNTTLIPLDQLPRRVNEVPRDREIVVVCRSGNRSREGTRILLENGFTQVSSMAGGVLEWSAKGYPFVQGP
ncbi:MAG: rhodanese-like domain-containing protein [Anaerolineales bacterium]|nr:rhodanese-like domain-containing protein [Anaerolineales bacterium]MDW8446979.1 rhodanese-like domain-containing protein [Anaerolineales bacterium]